MGTTDGNGLELSILIRSSSPSTLKRSIYMQLDKSDYLMSDAHKKGGMNRTEGRIDMFGNPITKRKDLDPSLKKKKVP
jgi:hypothetical protein